MSSLPSEVLRDVLLPLDRWTLDDVQFTNGRFLHLITKRMSDVCLRQTFLAAFQMPKIPDTGESWYMIRIDVSSSREIKKTHEDTVYLFSEFMQALHSSRVAHLTLNQLIFTPALAKLILETPVTVDQLRFSEGSFVEMTPAEFHEVVLYLSPTSLFIYTCDLHADHITDEFFRALNKNGLLRAFFQSLVPVGGGTFCVTDDAVIDFCMQPDVQVDQEGDEALGELVLPNGSFTKDLFKRLVEASAVSTRTQSFRIVVSPVRIVEQDLRDFAQHLSYRYRDTPHQQRIYDFPGEQHGAVAGMDLQIVLCPENTLALIRARRPNIYFYESNE